MARKRKKRIRRRMLLFCFIILIGLIIYFTFNIINNNEKKLSKLGYSDEEISIIIDNASIGDIKALVDKEYDEYYINIIKDADYKKGNMSEYVSYYEEYDKALASDIVYLINNDIELPYTETLSDLINNEEFVIGNLDKYINYSKNNKKADAESIILIVNNNIDAPYSSNLVSIIKDKYFIMNNLDRYLSYQNKNPELKANDIVTNVNSNLDYKFYTNVKDADTSKKHLILVNKYFKIDKEYTSDNLVSMDLKYTYNFGELDKDTYEAFKKMADDAAKENLYIKNRSAYRAYNTQSYIYNGYVGNYGYVWAENYSARPGHSEHQTGLALDIGASGSEALGSFESTNEFSWVKDNAHKYGFILRYPKGKEYITGYSYEPWHYRYVGVDTATKIYELDITYEEYYAYFLENK
ncbi:MAG: M15 family metallopeptidase [Bacilli bacterium]|nr:M15 family metallopeptidase [Bacilli bacterium]